LKSRDGLGETLDIIVADWQGERPYETFSGGEQLRIDLALRFALGEMLATRASSRIEWAVLDEGIGSQDAEHRALVLEAIKAISERFAMLLVITHIDEAVGMFPQKINIARREGEVEVHVE
jgi:exonuclease SbcC